MARLLQRRQLIQATTPRTWMWPKIGATPTHYWAVSMSISTNMVDAKWRNFSGLLLKNPTLVQKTLIAQLVARRRIATINVDCSVLRRRLELSLSPRLRR